MQLQTLRWAALSMSYLSKSEVVLHAMKADSEEWAMRCGTISWLHLARQPGSRKPIRAEQSAAARPPTAAALELPLQLQPAAMPPLWAAAAAAAAACGPVRHGRPHRHLVEFLLLPPPLQRQGTAGSRKAIRRRQQQTAGAGRRRQLAAARMPTARPRPSVQSTASPVAPQWQQT